VARVADPGGGSYYVESLTEQLAARAWSLLQRIEAEGGMAQAVTSGRVAAQIAEVAQARAALIAKRRQPVTGVSEYAHVAETAVERPALERMQAAPAAGSALRLSGSGAALVQSAIEAARQGAGIAQLMRALPGSGAQASCAALPLRRDAEPYEQLRDAADAHAHASGALPAVFLCNVGPIPQHKARAQFAAGFFQAGGFAVLDNDGFEAPAAAAAAFAESGASLAAICGSDDAYSEWIERLAPLLRERGARAVVLAGRAGDAEARYRKAGVSDFIYMGCDVVESLRTLQRAAGVQPAGAAGAREAT
jgi:methylmalonyl-CoA mutase